MCILGFSILFIVSEYGREERRVVLVFGLALCVGVRVLLIDGFIFYLNMTLVVFL